MAVSAQNQKEDPKQKVVLEDSKPAAVDILLEDQQNESLETEKSLHEDLKQQQEFLEGIMNGKPDNKMEYLWWQEQQDQQGTFRGSAWNEQQDTSNASGNRNAFQSFPTGTNKGREYWVNGSPVLEKVDYNGESVMLPELAPRDEKSVSTRNVIFEQTVSTIENHQGGSKVNWHWKTQMLNGRLTSVSPALYVTATQILPMFLQYTTLNVYTFSDVSLYGNTVQTELQIDDPGDGNAILAASRTACRYMGLTLTFEPRRSVPQGTLVDAATLPAASSLRVYFRAPQDANGLSAAVTKDVVTNNPAQLLLLGFPITFMALDRSVIPLKDIFDVWIRDQWHHAYFKAMVQIARSSYIGEEVVTESLNQRFQRLSQRVWDPVARKASYLSASEYHTTFQALLEETAGMNAVTIAQQVPELDAVFYRGLLPQLKDKPALAAMLQHAPSMNLGENIGRLQRMVESTKTAEREVNSVVQLSMNNRRYPIGGVTPNSGANAGRVFPALPMDAEDRAPRSGTSYSAIKADVMQRSSPSLAIISQVETFDLTMLSNAEKALRESSNSSDHQSSWRDTSDPGSSEWVGRRRVESRRVTSC